MSGCSSVCSRPNIKTARAALIDKLFGRLWQGRGAEWSIGPALVKDMAGQQALCLLCLGSMFFV